jgi:hypothetical protein
MNYPTLTIKGIGQIPIHIWKWECLHGKIKRGFILHHKDGDKTNYDIENLQLMTRREHLLLHRKKVKIYKTY